MHLFIIFLLILPFSFFGLETPSGRLAEITHSRNTSLVQMASEGNLPGVRLLCRVGASPNFVDEEIGESALTVAIEHDHEKVVSYLVNETDIDASKSVWFKFPMDKALERNNATIIELLGNKNAKIRSVNYQLKEALDKNRSASIKYLLMKAKANVNEKAWKDITPLHWAVQSGDHELISFLLTNGANKEALDESGLTPLFKAAKYPAIAKLLIENGANINHCTPAHQNHRTPLFYAVWSDNLDLVEHYIDHGADPNIIDSHNKTPLYYAIEAGNEPMVKLLLEKKAKPDLMFTKSVGYTPLSIASKNNLVEIVKLLLAHGANINLGDSHGETALLHARTSGATEAFNTLVAAGANVASAKNITGIVLTKLNPEIEKIVNRTAFQRFCLWAKNNSLSTRIANIFNGARTKAANSWTRWENTRIIGGILKKLRIW